MGGTLPGDGAFYGNRLPSVQEWGYSVLQWTPINEAKKRAGLYANSFYYSFRISRLGRYTFELSILKRHCQDIPLVFTLGMPPPVGYSGLRPLAPRPSFQDVPWEEHFPYMNSQWK